MSSGYSLLAYRTSPHPGILDAIREALHDELLELGIVPVFFHARELGAGRHHIGLQADHATLEDDRGRALATFEYADPAFPANLLRELLDRRGDVR